MEEEELTEETKRCRKEKKNQSEREESVKVREKRQKTRVSIRQRVSRGQERRREESRAFWNGRDEV